MSEPIIYRSGIGYDVHRFAPEYAKRPLILGGIEIPHPCGLDGHSDADVLSHAIADALLGAIGERDIGVHFPPGKDETKGIDSKLILAKALVLLNSQNASIVNIDATIVTEEPKINPHIEAMRSSLSETLCLSGSQIGLKATTHEKMGSLGRSEGIAAMAICSLSQQTAA